MTKGINRLARRSFHPLANPACLQFARLPLLRRAEHLFYFRSGNRLVAQSFDFHGSLRNVSALFFRILLRASVVFRRAFPHSLLSSRFWRTPANSLSSSMPSWPIDRGFEWQTCPALSMSARCFFAIDHSRWLSWSLTGNNVYMMTVNDVLGNISLS